MVTVTGIAPGASGVADGGECTSGAADRTRNGSLRVAAVFSDHMVLQRETPVAVFGAAPADGRVVVDLMDDQGVTVAQTMAVAQAYGEHETEARFCPRCRQADRTRCVFHMKQTGSSSRM